MDLECLVCSEKIEAIGCGLTETEVGLLRDITIAVQYKPKEVLFHEADTQEYYYQLTEGVVGVYNILPSGRRVILEILFEGDFLGPFGKGVYPYSSVALTKATLCRFPKKQMDNLIKISPDLKDKLNMFQENALNKARTHLLGMAHKSPLERLSSFLLLLFNNLYKATNSENSFEIPMGRQEMADYLSLTSETVSRAFTELADKQIITLDTPSHITIRQIDQLYAMVCGGPSLEDCPHQFG